ncbi:Uncharacterised protein [Vibrio cholerae]|uniref:Uncharacterized protein n=1 Tax=Vibrio cholerae TaxID=666 RepID=A0A655UVG6_VIBCL|nr:Uncharacterised protein [Vibrio cholerae]CSB90641.1 Uncharacterised protein [Vibrio cholerae]CSC19166.1 Uncharacterised protein [Vibrio cholerae]CSC55969.1 Uncharacterised protein [Vibrio cholerae]CSC55976.1 Uncharacterised protein [Vibrio cholerae]
MVTATSSDSSNVCSATKICCVIRSCTCGRWAKKRTIRLIFDKPMILPRGMYATAAVPSMVTKWCSHVLVSVMSFTLTISLTFILFSITVILGKLA